MSELAFGKQLRSLCPNIKLWRVENSCGPGMPDVHFITNSGATGWIELKYIQKVNHKVKFRIAQPKWLQDYHNAGGCVIILVKVSKTTIMAFGADSVRQLNRGIHVTNIDEKTCFESKNGFLGLEDFICQKADFAFGCVQSRSSHKHQL